MQPVRPLILILPLVLTGALAACLPVGPGDEAEPVPTGAEDFAQYCAVCHGSGGTGDGEMAAGLDPKPADLTRISARNGGTFPMTQVMAQIWGYAQEDGRVMPQFAPLLDGNLVLFDSGDGIATPTPLRLVQLGQYVQALQP
jgi:mono/diheme cytochrome c family protein